MELLLAGANQIRQLDLAQVLLDGLGRFGADRFQFLVQLCLLDWLTGPRTSKAILFALARTF
jgi:hypothetical protein